MHATVGLVTGIGNPALAWRWLMAVVQPPSQSIAPAATTSLAERIAAPRNPVRSGRGKSLGLTTWMRLAAFASVIVTGVLMSIAVRSNGEAIVATLAILCSLVALVPLLVRRPFDLFEPATAIFALVMFCVTAKTWMILAFDQSSDHVQDRLLLGYDPTVLIPGLWAMLIGLIALVIGYMVPWPAPRMATRWLQQSQQWNGPRLQLTCLVLLGVSALSFLLFIRWTGTSLGNPEELSAKRFAEQGSGGSGRLFQLGYYLYRLAAFCKFPFYLALVDLIARRRSWVSLHGMIIIVAGIFSIGVPIFINNRAGIALLLLDVLVILYYLRRSAVLPYLTVSFSLGLVLLCGMLMLRKQNNEFTFVTLLEETLGGRDLMDISKTSHIIQAVPQTIEYQMGETLWGWVAAPVPRSIWPGKPLWAERGVYLMHKVYGNMVGYSGIPPGLVAELYWNLGWYGVVFGMLTLGVVLRVGHQTFLPMRHVPVAVLVYALIVNRFVLFSLGNDLGTGIVKTGLDIVPLAFLLLWLSKRTVVIPYEYYRSDPNPPRGVPIAPPPTSPATPPEATSVATSLAASAAAMEGIRR
jgi:hypothetical protein